MTQFILHPPNGTVSAVSGEEAYWQSTKPATVTAWYTSPTYTSTTDGTTTINLSDQSSGLAYVLKAEATSVAFGEKATLAFEHQLAKVRVKITANIPASSVVSIYGYPKCTVSNGTVTASGTKAYIPMYNTEYDGATYYEACLAPGTLSKANAIQITAGGYTLKASLTDDVTLTAGSVHTLDISSAVNIIDLSELSSTYYINDSGTYYFTGSNASNGYGISVTGGSPKIYLDDATIAVSGGNAISITGSGTATIHVSGNNKVKNTSYQNTTKYGAGIYVASNSSVVIEGDSQSDVLTARAGSDGAGIGSYEKASGLAGANCGNITIKNVTVKAYGAGNQGSSPGIGGMNSCGAIAIEGANVEAHGAGESAPAIGVAGTGTEWNNITINNSTIGAYRAQISASYINYYSDYIGKLYDSSDQAGNILGTIKSSTVTKYTYTYYDSQNLTNNGTVKYDENGSKTETTE